MTNQELDRAVALGPMGYIKYGNYENMWETPTHYITAFRPSADPRDTERVMDRMRELGFKSSMIEISNQIHWTFSPTAGGPPRCRHDNDPDWKRAVCLAALEATK